MNNILLTTKWAVKVESAKDGEILQELFPKGSSHRNNSIKGLVERGNSYRDKLILTPCNPIFNNNSWMYGTSFSINQKDGFTIYTIKELQQLMKPTLKTKEQLPFKYFVVQNDESQEFDNYLKWLNNEYGCNWAGFDFMYYFGYTDSDDYIGGNGTNNYRYSSEFENNPKVFTAKEFMDILREEKMSNKKIIGYKAPMDLFKGQVKKGEIYVSSEVGMAHPERINCHYVPKEIVETWEAVYEEVKPQYKVGDWVTIDVKFVEKDKPNHTLVLGNKYKLTQKLKDNNIPDSYKDHYDWEADCWLNSKWFRLATPEEIVLAQEEIVSMGEFEVVIKPNGIFHKNDNITDFCKGLHTFNNSLPTSLGGFAVNFAEIAFTKTGCQNNTTTLDAWVNVYTKYLAKKSL
jgi:hypothetical protein